jgi:Predicted pyridoxal phosphate-dependent enzyme apparently involved in regulation of cell wall biogenesis
MGEGGALLIQDPAYIEEAEILREKGTDRSKYFRGQVDKYRWMNFGSSYLPSDMNAAYLYTQFEMAEEINQARMDRWNQYYELLLPLQKAGKVELPTVPKDCKHNGHMFYIKTKDLEERTRLIDFMKKKDVLAVFHYVPLHSAPAGRKFGRFHGEDKYTTRESERLLRLPMFYQLTGQQTAYIAGAVREFYGA